MKKETGKTQNEKQNNKNVRWNAIIRSNVS